MRKISFAFQEMLKFCLIFFLFFVWLRYFLDKLWLSVFLAVLLTCVLQVGIYFFKRKKKKKIGLKFKEKEEAENMFLSLACENKPIDFFEKLASKKHKDIIKHKDYLVITHHLESASNSMSNSTLKAKTSSKSTASSTSTASKEEIKKTLLYVDFSFEGLTIPRFMAIYNKVKKEKAEKIVICCKEIVDKKLPSFVSNFDEKFLILDVYSTYEKLYKFYDCFPEITKKYQKEKKMAFKDFVAYSFNKQRTKGYLFSAIILIICGLFVRATLYYCIIASLLVVFALISQFNPIYNLKSETDVL